MRDRGLVVWHEAMNKVVAMDILNHSSLFRCGAAFVVLFAAVNLSGAGENRTLGELRIRGDSIVRLTLVGKQGTGMTFESPGEMVKLRVGEYRVQHVELKDDYSLDFSEGRRQEWFEVTLEGPNELVVGGPLQPTVTARRHGGFIQMDYDTVDGEGRRYRWDPRTTGTMPPAPTFTIYKGEEKIGSGSFEYG